jgi:hypothetical protein
VEYSPFYGIEKGAVLQEARVFNDSHVDPRRCQQVITKLLYLLTQGESFTKVRALWWGRLMGSVWMLARGPGQCAQPLRQGGAVAWWQWRFACGSRPAALVA